MRILIIFGTRPEAVKMAPIIKKLIEVFADSVKVCVTAQHREMLDQVLSLFEIIPDYDLDVMAKNQSLAGITSACIIGLEKIMDIERPELVLVHGDTTTTFVAALSAFYHKVPIGHIEAGLRSHNTYAPWPEEMNRCLTARLTDLHFVPTTNARDNLLKENIAAQQIYVTGNTIVDALLQICKVLNERKSLKENLDKKFSYLEQNKKLILMTGHRRENFGEGFKQICLALREIAKRDDVQILYPVHLNPHIQEVTRQYLLNYKNIFLISPQDYLSFVYLMQKSYIILTDSGGVQEEAPTFGKPVLIMRDVTERTEAVLAGIAKLVGTKSDLIVKETIKLLNDSKSYTKMIAKQNPFGDGQAAERILKVIIARHTNAAIVKNCIS